VNLCMFVNAHTCILGLNERYIMCTYVAYVQEQNWQQPRVRQTDRERERETENWTIKHRGMYHTFFVLNGTVWKKQDHSLQCSIWVQIENIVFNFDIALKSVVGMQ
jgi:hypothetical protein